MKINYQISDTILRKVLDLKPTESFLMITDKPKKELGMQVYEYAKNITPSARIEIIKELERDGQEPEPEVAELMLNHDVQFYLTSKSLSHTNARRNATKKGHRIISAPGLTYDMMKRCVDIDYDEIIKFHDRLRPVIADSKEIHITTKAGTDITTAVHDTQGQSDNLLKNKQGAFGNLPTGEIDSGVVREKTNGIIVFDGSFPGLGLLEELIKVKVVDGVGKITIDNNKAKTLYNMLKDVNPNAFKLAELGIGTNPKAILTGNVLEDEKVKGTVHFAFGNDLTYNGNNDVPVHLDGVLRNPTLKVDGKIIMKDGKFIDEFY